MPEQQNSPDQARDHLIAYWSEQETAQYCRLELGVIQQLTEAGVVSGVEVAGEAQRRYAAADLVRLRRARRLYQDLGVNLEGIEIILRLVAHIEMLQREVARSQGMAEHAE